MSVHFVHQFPKIINNGSPEKTTKLANREIEVPYAWLSYGLLSRLFELQEETVLCRELETNEFTNIDQVVSGRSYKVEGVAFETSNIEIESSDSEEESEQLTQSNSIGQSQEIQSIEIESEPEEPLERRRTSRARPSITSVGPNQDARDARDDSDQELMESDDGMKDAEDDSGDFTSDSDLSEDEDDQDVVDDQDAIADEAQPKKKRKPRAANKRKADDAEHPETDGSRPEKIQRKRNGFPPPNTVSGAILRIVTENPIGIGEMLATLEARSMPVPTCLDVRAMLQSTCSKLVKRNLLKRDQPGTFVKCVDPPDEDIQPMKERVHVYVPRAGTIAEGILQVLGIGKVLHTKDITDELENQNLRLPNLWDPAFGIAKECMKLARRGALKSLGHGIWTVLGMRELDEWKKAGNEIPRPPHKRIEGDILKVLADNPKGSMDVAEMMEEFDNRGWAPTEEDCLAKAFISLAKRGAIGKVSRGRYSIDPPAVEHISPNPRKRWSLADHLFQLFVDDPSQEYDVLGAWDELEQRDVPLTKMASLKGCLTSLYKNGLIMDVGDQTYRLSDHPAQDVAIGVLDVDDQVLPAFIDNPSDAFTAKTILEKFGDGVPLPSQSTIGASLVRLCKKGFIVRIKRGVYRLSDRPAEDMLLDEPDRNFSESVLEVLRDHADDTLKVGDVVSELEQRQVRIPTTDTEQCVRSTLQGLCQEKLIQSIRKGEYCIMIDVDSSDSETESEGSDSAIIRRLKFEFIGER